ATASIVSCRASTTSAKRCSTPTTSAPSNSAANRKSPGCSANSEVGPAMTIYTHGHHDSVLRSHSNRNIDNSAAYMAAWLQPGLSLLDVGSGPGTITADFAQRLAPGRVTALEINDDAVALTRAEIERQGLDNVTYRTGDVHDLPLADDCFNIVHAHQLLQHVGDPVQALCEMRRVCKPGGIVAVCDSDYAGFI